MLSALAPRSRTCCSRHGGRRCEGGTPDDDDNNGLEQKKGGGAKGKSPRTAASSNTGFPCAKTMAALHLQRVITSERETIHTEDAKNNPKEGNDELGGLMIEPCSEAISYMINFSVGNLSGSGADARTPNALASHDCCPMTSPRYRVASLEAGI